MRLVNPGHEHIQLSSESIRLAQATHCERRWLMTTYLNLEY